MAVRPWDKYRGSHRAAAAGGCNERRPVRHRSWAEAPGETTATRRNWPGPPVEDPPDAGVIRAPGLPRWLLMLCIRHAARAGLDSNPEMGADYI